MRERKALVAAEPVSHSEPLHIKYRPQSLRDMYGQEAVVKSLEKALVAKARNHCYLFTGPAGTGKTTLSRILARELNCGDIQEVDAASNSGIDAMREVTASLRYHGFGEAPNRAIIIDECHGLSKQAWDSLLITTEQPPPHVYFFFCTTVEGKIPKTMETRCLAYTLKPLRWADSMDLLEFVRKQEGLKTPDGILELIASSCEGSPRMALTMLAKVQDCEDLDEAEVLLEAPAESAEVIDLCRAIMKGDLVDNWGRARDLLVKIDQPAESIRIVITAYFSKVVMGEKTQARDVKRCLDVLECFSRPFNPSDKHGPLLLALADIVWPRV